MRALRWALASAVLMPVVLLAPQGRAAAKVTATLRPGGAAFWSATAARANGGGLREYRIAVREGGYRLRVAFDHPDYRVPVYGTLSDPKGKEVAGLYGYNSGEAYVLHPAPGTWTLRMSAAPDDSEFRMRAKLEGRPPAKPRKPVALLPNLRLVPPYEFTFKGPVSGSRAIVMGPGVPGVSCTADDRAEQAGIKCLRFSLGPANAGAGPLLLDFPGGQGLATPGQATQVITWSDGHKTTRAAGEFVYHKTHGHYHHSGFGKLELLKVSDAARGTYEHVGDGPKQGFCTADVMVADWKVFGGVQNSADSTCLDNGSLVYDPTRGTKMGLSPGWADLYSWEQDGNYVEFGVNGDGRYVVRSTADALDNVLESNEKDNTSYAYIQVTGTDVQVLERGRGQGPWDRHKVVVHDGLHPNAAV
jgi:hypothetical protein